ncbi:hypothetical protein AB0E67_10385 [Streptomyces sp. NPDC032161]|uniref:hypothetical protein n=1 Tax=unclassified Streptomyces TaxID=2593676 RepID=UPI0033FA16C0
MPTELYEVAEDGTKLRPVHAERPRGWYAGRPELDGAAPIETPGSLSLVSAMVRPSSASRPGPRTSPLRPSPRSIPAAALHPGHDLQEIVKYSTAADAGSSTPTANVHDSTIGRHRAAHGTDASSDLLVASWPGSESCGRRRGPVPGQLSASVGESRRRSAQPHHRPLGF